jgi:hypothetical protein
MYMPNLKLIKMSPFWEGESLAVIFSPLRVLSPAGEADGAARFGAAGGGQQGVAPRGPHAAAPVEAAAPAGRRAAAEPA